MSELLKFESSVKELGSQWKGKGKNFNQLLENYKTNALSPVKHKLDFSPWLPELAKIVRPVVPGEMLCILSDTGSGKTLLLQQIIMKVARPMKTLFLEMELPDDQLVERFIAMKAGIGTDRVSHLILNGLSDDSKNAFDHVTVYSESKFSIQDIEEIIDIEQPQVVILDYLGLVRSKGGSRYERLSDNAEELKLVASTKKVILLTACQVSRKKDATTGEIFLHDARDSSSIENSAQKMLGLWREGEDGKTVKIKVLKNQGPRDMIFTYNLNIETLNIWRG